MPTSVPYSTPSGPPAADPLAGLNPAALLAELERWEAGTLRPLEWDRRFLPHYFTHAPADLHLWLDGYLHERHARRGSRLALIAPREAAKSTVVTLAYVLRCAVEGWEPYTLILSDSSEQANKLLQDLRAELEGNPHLAAVYPAACGPGSGEWREGAVRLRSGGLVESLGRGAKVRGRRNRQARPSLIVMDDVQGNRDVVSATERQRAFEWLTREIIPAGTDATNIVSVGTALHREAVAVKAGSLPGWEAVTFRAVKRWPNRMDLWDEWARLATNLADPDRLRTAEAFHAAHAAEMDAGAETYWPDRKPIAALMAKRAEIGSAFSAEYQGVPYSPAGAEFPAEFFDWPGLWWSGPWPDDLVVRAMSLDPSKGSEARTGDYQAHVMAALSESGRGTIFVDAVLAREAPALMVARGLDLAAGFGPVDEYAVEENDGLGMLVPEFERQLGERRAVVPLRAYH